jgi:hypothetical protein
VFQRCVWGEVVQGKAGPDGADLSSKTRWGWGGVGSIHGGDDRCGARPGVPVSRA